jgi:hypothetical protein
LVTQSEQSEDCGTVRIEGMSASPQDLGTSFSDQLSEFDAKIRSQEDNATLLNEIHASITQLLSDSMDREEEIRGVLERHYNRGKLRLETFQLVRNVIDRVVIESMPTMPGAVERATDEEEDAEEATVVAGHGPGSEHLQLQVGAVLRDRFLLQQRVAGGSMGVVYKAHDRRLAEAEGFDPWVAIKVLSPKLSRNAHALRALQQEAAKGRCLSHPNIVRFIDLDRDGDIYFIVMEWLEGRSLAAILDENRNRKIDLTTSLDIVRQVGQALDYAHRCGVIHADVKPANIMLTPEGEVKLFDFGIARVRQQEDHRQGFDPGVLGAVTPAYSSVQVLRGESPVAADDVYSLGCLMYRMVAGHRAFGPRNALEAADQGMEPQPPQALSDTQWRALKKALAFSRGDRYATPAEFLAALDADGDRGSLPVRPLGERILVEAKRVVPERRRPWGLGVLLLVLLAAAGLFVLRPDLLPQVGELVERPGAETTSPEAGDVPAAAGTQEATGEAADSPGEVGQGGVFDPTAPAESTAETGTGEAPTADEMPDDTLPGAPAAAGDTAGEPALRDSPAEEELEVLPPPQGEPVERTGPPAPLEDEAVTGPPAPADESAGAGEAAQALPGAAGEITQGAAGDEPRPYEAGLPPDTIGFSTSTLRVREGDAAVAIDVIRLNPTNEELYVRYAIRDGTAVEGEDYFLPVAPGLVFAPGQRSARLLISIVQDSLLESDESFTLSLRDAVDVPQANLHQNIEIVIRDDDGV